MRALVVAVEPAFGVQSGLAAGGGAGDGLAVGVVFYVASSPYAVDVSKADVVTGTALGFQVAGFVHIKLAFKEVGVRFVADGDEHAFYRDVFGVAVVLFQAGAGYAAVVAEDVVQVGVELEDDFAFFYALH